VSADAILSFGGELRLQRAVAASDHIDLVLEPTTAQSQCSLCSTVSNRIQSRYVRSLTDLPIQGIPVRLRLSVRRFVCTETSCPRKIFCERLPDLAPAYARLTTRLKQSLRIIGIALGGEAGARLATKLGMKASGDTILELLRATPSSNAPTARIIGIDDWALRRGQNYGTIVVDLERRRPIDVVHGRDAAAVASWLAAHPGIEVVARDRWSAYADGIRQGAPNAVQVADRFHLVKNARDVLEQVLDRHRGVLREAAEAVGAPPRGGNAAGQGASAEVNTTHELYQRGQRERLRREAFNAERRARYEAVQALKREGYAVADVKRKLNIHFDTARKLFHADTYPEIVRPKRATVADRFDAYLRQRWSEGERNVEQLYREVMAKGYTGSSLTLRRYMNTWRKRAPIGAEAANPKSRAVPAPQTTSWLLLKTAEELKGEQRAFVTEVLQRSDAIAMATTLIKQFRAIVGGRKASELASWLDSAFASGVRELRNFVTSLRKDQDAVKAAVTQVWSTGPVEGHINRLKLLKRQMYGRAKLDLLRIRLLEAA
jgi:transposase